MMKMLRKKRKGGFTLIELIVVIAILGILAAIAVPRLMSFTDRAEASAEDATLRTVQSAWAIYNADGQTQTWPTAYLDGVVSGGTGTDFDITSNNGGTTFNLTLSGTDWSITTTTTP